jgi:hypothetical protein
MSGARNQGGEMQVCQIELCSTEEMLADLLEAYPFVWSARVDNDCQPEVILVHFSHDASGLDDLPSTFYGLPIQFEKRVGNVD